MHDVRQSFFQISLTWIFVNMNNDRSSVYTPTNPATPSEAIECLIHEELMKNKSTMRNCSFLLFAVWLSFDPNGPTEAYLWWCSTYAASINTDVGGKMTVHGWKWVCSFVSLLRTCRTMVIIIIAAAFFLIFKRKKSSFGNLLSKRQLT